MHNCDLGIIASSAKASAFAAPALIASISKALRLSYIELDKKYQEVLILNNYLKEKLNNYENVHINSINNIPHMLNFSVKGIKPETLHHALEEYNIYISTQSACATGNVSKAVMAITNNEELAKSSVRISISYLTKKEDIDKFLECFDICYKRLI